MLNRQNQFNLQYGELKGKNPDGSEIVFLNSENYTDYISGGTGSTPDLAGVLAEGNETDGNDIVLSTGDKITGDEIVLESTDGTNTSEIKVEPTQIEQNLTDGTSDVQVKIKPFEINEKLEGPSLIFGGTNNAYGAILSVENETFNFPGTTAAYASTGVYDGDTNVTNFDITGDVTAYFTTNDSILLYRSDENEYPLDPGPTFSATDVQFADGVTTIKFNGFRAFPFYLFSPDLGGAGTETMPPVVLGDYYFQASEDVSSYFDSDDSIIVYDLLTNFLFNMGTAYVSSVLVDKIYLDANQESQVNFLSSGVGQNFYIYTPSLGGAGIETIPIIYDGDTILTSEIKKYSNEIIQSVTDGTRSVELSTSDEGVRVSTNGPFTFFTAYAEDDGYNSSITVIPNLIIQNTSDGNDTTIIEMSPTKIEQTVTDGTNTSEIKIEPTQITQKVESGDINSEFVFNKNKTFITNYGIDASSRMWSYASIGEVTNFTIDPTPFPIIGYANQTITFTQVSTSGDGVGFEIEILFDNNGDVSNTEVISAGEFYEIGDTITTTDEGDGALTITVDTIDDYFVTLNTSDGNTTASLTLKPTQVSINTIALLLPNIPTYADNAAAVADDYPEHGVYKTSTGELRIVI
jgi:hypothetical protein